MIAKQNTTKSFLVGPILDADGVAKTDEVVGSIKVTKNGSVGSPNAASTLTHNHTGHYVYAANAADFDTLGEVEFSLNSGTNAMGPVKFQVVPANVYDSVVDGTDRLQVDAREVGGTAAALGAVAGNIPVVGTGTNQFKSDAAAKIAATVASGDDVDGAAVKGILSGITSLAAWLRGLFRKDAMDATAKTEANTGGGTFDETTDSLQAIRDRGDAAWVTGGDTGGGARTVTITVTDGTDPLENAKVRMTNGAESYLGTTNAIGVTVFALDDATWTVAITKFGYTFTATTLVVSGNTPHTYSMTQTVTPSSTPGQVTGFMYCYDENGVAEKDVTIKVWLTAVAENMGVAYDLAPRSATSNAEGLVQFSGMFLGATYSVQRGLGLAKAVTIPTNASDPYELVSVIGSP